MGFLCSSLLVISMLSSLALADLNVTSWSSPTSGSVYESSEVVRCVFYSNSLLEPPGFRLCVMSGNTTLDQDGTDGEGMGQGRNKCGALVFPEVIQNGTMYSSEVAMPSVNLDLQCYIALQDSRGSVATSPVFLLSPTKPQQPLHGQSLAGVVFPPALPVTDESSSSLPSRVLVYAIPLGFLGLVLLTGTSVYIYRRRRNHPTVSSLHTSRDRDGCTNDKCGDPITCAHTLRSHSRGSYTNEKTASEDARDIYTSYYARSLPHQPRQSTKAPFRPGPRRSTVPARLFKDAREADTASVSSRSSTSSERSGSSHGQGLFPTAMTYDRIASQYLQPSSQSSFAIATEAVTPPQRLHTRRGTTATRNGMERRVTHGHSGSI
ncbi:hypothetical protein EUX98_g7395 [Antrodiella citrinella]|uniref:C2H2-type domain-containing protein n=1 Tax=Antrodiella citrinella TaxID=2447956 RepID=A0A4S4MLL0_9APHY|nr:hypothetical protein EUX98_g7395 [Antrodiella citrinella]